MAETARRFVVHSESRRFARIAGYPAGLVLLVAAVFIPADEDAWLKVFAAVVGLCFVTWSWSVDRRRRVEVTDQNVTVVNVCSRFEVPWSELNEIEIDMEENSQGPDEFYLAFVTPSRRIRANMPYENRDELSKVRARILQVHEPLAHHVESDAQAAGAADAERQPRTVRDWLMLAVVFAFIVLFGLPVIYFFVLDALAGDWLVDHVPFWDELVGFYEGLWFNAS